MQAEKAVERFEESGAVLGDLGMALIRLAKFEAEQGAASAGYSVTAAASRSLAADCQRTGKVSRTHAGRSEELLCSAGSASSSQMVLTLAHTRAYSVVLCSAAS